ncbi:major facilitator superfamily transporter [Pyrenophora seminiperda CCB06]|uniref:Major facilitator superfamily transporter n=1 Tax=Pyrenophora seminiperda CCB06 TaxID=1302712 RepID=A0A3M7M0P7_9PLEO|nr:major facilitator superfamily transporter [Pyrenophora seminiperda CCB06]
MSGSYYFNDKTESLEDPHPKVELAPPPRVQPLAEPRTMSPLSNVCEDIEKMAPLGDVVDHLTRPRTASSTAKLVKRESYDLSGSTFLITNDGKTLKLPIPSESKADPLNWSQRKTAGAIFSIALFSVICLTAAQATTVILEGVQVEFASEVHFTLLVRMKDANLAYLAYTGMVDQSSYHWTYIMYGLRVSSVGAIVDWYGPSAYTFDRNCCRYTRPALGWRGSVVSRIGCSCVFYWVGRRIVAITRKCLALDSCDAFRLQRQVFLMIIDLTYINQRSTAVATMWCVAGGFGTSGVAFVPVITGHSTHWREFYHIWMIPVAISFVVSFFLYPETYFKRPTVAFDGLILMQSATEKLTVYQDTEDDSSLYRDLPQPPPRTGFAGFRDRIGIARSPFASWTAMGRCYIQMGYCAMSPLLFWVFVASGFNSASMMFIGATYARVLLAEPYNFSPEIIGTVNIASGFGALLALPVCTFVTGRGITRLSKRNHGVQEAEHYLIAYILPVVVGSLSSLLYGLAVHQRWGPVSIYVAYGMNGFAFVTLMTANTLWVTEAFPRWAAPALAVVGGGLFTESFALSFVIVPWINAHGYMWVGVELMLFQIVGGLIAMPVAFWGKSARQAIAGRWADDRSGALRPL